MNIMLLRRRRGIELRNADPSWRHLKIFGVVSTASFMLSPLSKAQNTIQYLVIESLPDIPMSSSRISCDSLLLDSPTASELANIPPPPNSPSSLTSLSSPNPWSQFFHHSQGWRVPTILAPPKSYPTFSWSDSDQENQSEGYRSTPPSRARNFSLPSSGLGDPKGRIGEVFTTAKTGRWRSFSEGGGEDADFDARGARTRR